MKLAIVCPVAPYKLPKISTKGKDYFDLSLQNYAVEYTGTAQLPNGKWTLLKNYTPEEIQLIKYPDRKPRPGEAHQPKETDLDENFKTERNSHYSLYVKATYADDQSDDQSLSELFQNLTTRIPIPENQNTWRVQKLLPYQPIKKKLVDGIQSISPQLHRSFNQFDDLKPFHHSFIARSKNKITLAEAMELADATGSKILYISANKNHSPIALITWIRGTYLDRSAENNQHLALFRKRLPTLAKLNPANQEPIIQFSPPEAGIKSERYHYLFQWAAPHAEMHAAAIQSGQILKKNATIEEQSLFYCGEWEFTSDSKVYRYILHPDGLAELWHAGKLSDARSLPKRTRTRWKISADGTLIIMANRKHAESIFKTSPTIPNHVVLEKGNDPKIVTMTKAVDSWANPQLGSREIAP